MPSCFPEPLVRGCALGITASAGVALCPEGVGLSCGLTCEDPGGSAVVSGVLGLLAPHSLPARGAQGSPGPGRVYPQVSGRPLSSSLLSEILRRPSLCSRLRAQLGPVPEAGGVLCPKLEECSVRLSPGCAQTPVPFRTPHGPLPAGNSTPGVHPPPCAQPPRWLGCVACPSRARRPCEALPSLGDLRVWALPSELNCCWSGEVGSQGVTTVAQEKALQGRWTPRAALPMHLPGVQTAR